MMSLKISLLLENISLPLLDKTSEREPRVQAPGTAGFSGGRKKAPGLKAIAELPID
jgi:hypothetical protein